MVNSCRIVQPGSDTSSGTVVVVTPLNVASQPKLSDDSFPIPAPDTHLVKALPVQTIGVFTDIKTLANQRDNIVLSS